MGKEYESHSTVQKSINDLAIPQLLTALESVHQSHPSFFSTPGPFTVANLGCANGANAVPLLRAVIVKVREYNPHKEIVIMLNDLPGNDFSAALSGVSEALRDVEGVYVHACAKSFYARAFPDGSVDLFLSFAGIHWMDCEHGPSTHDGFVQYLTAFEPSPVAAHPWTEEARTDWLKFVSCRLSELRPHGILAVSTVTLNRRKEDCDAILSENIEQKKAFRGRVAEFLFPHMSPEQELRLTVPIVVRRVEDFVAPLGAVPGAKVFCAEYSEFVLPFPKSLSAEKLARALGEGNRAVYEPFLVSALKREGEKDEAKIKEFMKAFFDDVGKIAADSLAAIPGEARGAKATIVITKC